MLVEEPKCSILGDWRQVTSQKAPGDKPQRRVGIQRAVRAMIAAGVRVTGVKVERDGSFEILTGASTAVTVDDFAEWKANHDARRAKGH